MADPLSIASSIVGILAAAGKITDMLGPYISAVRETPRIAASVHSEVVGSRIILSALHGLLQTLSTASRSRTLLVPIDELIAVFTNGVLIFSELESSITPMCLDGADRIMGRMQWTRASGKLSDLLSRLQAFKQTTLDSDREAAKTQDELSSRVITLLQNADMFRRLERLEDTFGALRSIEPEHSSRCERALPDGLSHDLARQSIVRQSHDSVCPAPESPPLTAVTKRSSSTRFEFQSFLDESLPYRRAQDGLEGISTRVSVTTATTSKASSVFSGVSLSDVTVLSHVAIPVYPADISNAHHYQFMQPTPTSKVYTARRPNGLSVGKWAKAVRRVARPRELRLDIQFEVPVLFLCAPGTTTGPLANQPVVLIDGSAQSLENSRVDLPAAYAPPANGREVLRKERSATHKEVSGRASWVDLISALQRLERDSRAWDRKEVAKRQILPQTSADGARGGPTLAVALQRKPGSWSALPSNLKRPVATTTWGDLIALAAWLGMYWTDVDRARGCYRAQGNGHALDGSEVAGVGTVFTFRVQGGSRFEENRVTPVAAVRELCFGLVPTIFHAAAAEDDGCRRGSAGLSLMNFSSRADVAGSLVALGCDAVAAARFFTEDGIVSHVYPVVFEVAGMLAQSFHIQNSGFKRLPNPTPYRWDTRAFSLPLMLDAFASQMRLLSAGGSGASVVQRRLAQYSSDLCELWTPTSSSERTPSSSTVAILDRLHYVTEKLDGILKAKTPGFDDQTPLAADSDSDSPRRSLVLLVLVTHVQGVLAGLNEHTAATGTTRTVVDVVNDEDAAAADPLAVEEEALRWRDVRSAPPEIRQHTLMRIYFDIVRPKVIAEVQRAMSPERGRQVASRVDDVWCTLVFRSICWLMLHDFHPMDVQIPKSDLYGSDVPVFIA